MKLTIVYNPHSGSAMSKDALHKLCIEANIEVETFLEVGPALKKAISPYIKRGQHIAAIGGDGTISSVAELLKESPATLVPLPGGTLNHFTKDLGVPQQLEDALKRLPDCTPKLIDIASVNEIFFINNSSIGLYPASLRDREELEPRTGKWLGAAIAAFRALFQFTTYRVTMGTKSFTTPFIFVGNNRYTFTPADGVSRTRLDENILTVYVAITQKRLTLCKIAFFALIGKSSQLPEFDVFHPTSLRIQTTRRSISVSHDGEVSRTQATLDYKIHSKKLRVLC